MSKNKTCIVLLGPAGSGKTTLTHRFGYWLSELDIDTALINLDPAARNIPYNADYDIRSIIDVEDIMTKEKLGPNGAVIRAAELMEAKSGEIVNNILNINKNMYLIDTPGQMEIFLFHRSGVEIIRAIRQHIRTISILLIDPKTLISPVEVVVMELLNLIVRLKLETPTLAVINKFDLVTSKEVIKIVSNRRMLRKAIRKINGVQRDLALKCTDVLINITPIKTIIPISATTSKGFEELYGLIHEVWCECGET
ncbi:MAG: ATP/GTP-binding protein [Candidatus Methanomethylicia archaeon]